MRVQTGMAHAISHAAAPPVLAALAAILLAARSADGGAWGWAAAFCAAAVVVPSLYILVQVQRGAISDIHIPLREQRMRPFLVTLAASAGVWGLFTWMQAPAGFRALAVANVAQALALFAITLRWKVSLHSAAAGSLSTLGLTVLGVSAWSTAGMLLVASVPVIAWARIRLDRHTPAQTVVGALLGALLTLLAILVV